MMNEKLLLLKARILKIATEAIDTFSTFAVLENSEEVSGEELKHFSETVSMFLDKTGNEVDSAFHIMNQRSKEVNAESLSIFTKSPEVLQAALEGLWDESSKEATEVSVSE